ncbi:YdcF family protein [Thermanaerovibrio acidaminovorans]|uniref:YdcF family protein n=1 Tax=Thermanaerovibrio acidaminovorans TaxID=81462 RepID=UPI002490BA2E|nr:YdcF family protein [Thermanaerovibrio acidaminovorans]
MSTLFFLYKLAGALAVPPGIFVLACLLMALCCLRQPRRWGLLLACLATGIAIYSASCDWSARFITGPLEDMYESHPLPTDDGVIVLLGGGVRYDRDLKPYQLGNYTSVRVLKALQLHRDTGWPIVCCGGNPRLDPDPEASEANLMAQTLMDMGATQVYREGRSRTTWENLVNALPILRRLNRRNVVIVTSSFHMPRAIMTARAVLKGFDVYPHQAGRLTDRSPMDPISFLPLSMSETCLGLREWVGMGAYRVMSLLRRSDAR